MKIRSLAIAVLAFWAAAASAQNVTESGYWSGSGTWKNSTGQCWRSSYWTAPMATAECDPELVRKPAPEAPVVAPRAAPTPPPPPPPAPAAKPTPPKPQPLNVTFTDTFASGSAAITPSMRQKIDNEIVAKLNDFQSISSIRVEGHTDRMGNKIANQRLSERRANAVASYLATKGVDKGKIETIGWGTLYPVKTCPDQKNRKALAECLAPNRRVSVQVTGVRK